MPELDDGSFWFLADGSGAPHDRRVRVSVVTPSLNSARWLRLCVASVADQGAMVEHIVQDGGSSDGTLEWLSTDRRARGYVEKDRGMYDAINRGFRRATGDIYAYLNCDEQYLPRALRDVMDVFQENPEVGVLFGDVIFTRQDGSYAWHRKMQPPSLYHTWTCHLSTMSCGMFFRRELFREGGFGFDASLRDVGDGEWMLRLLKSGIKMRALGRFTSIFTLTGANMSVGPNAMRENRELRRSAPLWAQAARPWWILCHRLRRWRGGMYRQAAFSYELYTLESPERRVLNRVAHPTVHRTP